MMQSLPDRSIGDRRTFGGHVWGGQRKAGNPAVQQAVTRAPVWGRDGRDEFVSTLRRETIRRFAGRRRAEHVRLMTGR